MSQTFSLKPGDWTLLILKPCRTSRSSHFANKKLNTPEWEWCGWYPPMPASSAVSSYQPEFWNIRKSFWMTEEKTTYIIQSEQENAQFFIGSWFEFLKKWQETLANKETMLDCEHNLAMLTMVSGGDDYGMCNTRLPCPIELCSIGTHTRTVIFLQR